MISAGQEKLRQREDGPEKEAVTRSISDIEQRWSELHSKVTLRQDCIQRILPLSKDCSETIERLLPWISTADNEARSVRAISCDHETLIQQKRVIEVSFHNNFSLISEACLN